jgi:hypothetical protein
MKLVHSLLLAFTPLLSLPFAAAVGQEAVQSQPSDKVASTDNVEAQEIIVIGLKDPFMLSRKQLNDMLRANGRHKPTYAPRSQLLLAVESLDGRPTSGTKIWLASSSTEIALPQDGLGRYILPEDHSELSDYELRTNFPRKKVAISLWVMSPDASHFDRPMGDLRLQCEVMWAAAKSTISPFVRALFVTAGACGSKRIAFYMRSSFPLASARLINGKEERALRVSRNQIAYLAPIYEDAVPNSARVKLKPLQ